MMPDRSSTLQRADDGKGEIPEKNALLQRTAMTWSRMHATGTRLLAATMP
jgi:hypothetical protein